jgi:hypothetical protein
MSGIAKTPSPPYYAVIFSSVRTDGDHGYGAMADRMVELAAQQEESGIMAFNQSIKFVPGLAAVHRTAFSRRLSQR